MSDLEAANQRAAELIPQLLTPAERQLYERSGVITITGSLGGKYTVHTDRGPVGNIRTHQDVQLARSGYAYMGTRLCAHAPGTTWSRGKRYEVPAFDHFISQILAIKADERTFLNTAFYYG